MPRLSAELRESQRLIVERIKATNPANPVSNERIAEVAGTCATVVSKWVSAKASAREMKWNEVRALADVFGYDVVIGSAAGAKGFRVSRLRTKAPADPVGATLAMTGSALAAVEVVRTAMADGKVDAKERPIVRAALEAALANAETAAAIGEA